MRKLIRKRIRRSEGGVDLAADIDAAVAVNTGKGAQRTVVRSSHSVVQGDSGDRDRPEESPTDLDGPSEEKS